jgi:hypothetical protein
MTGSDSQERHIRERWTTLWPLFVFVVSAIATAADVLSIAGTRGSLRLLVLVTVLAAGLGSAGIIFMRVLKLARENSILADRIVSQSRKKLIRLHEILDSGQISHADLVQCMGSGSETYLSFVQEGIRSGVITARTRIEIGFRMTPPGPRDEKLRHFSRKWDLLAGQNKLTISFHPGPNFDHAIRGAIIRGNGKMIGGLGVYVRTNDNTLGQEFPLFPVSGDTEMGQILSDAISQIMDSRPSFLSIAEAVNARDGITESSAR